MMSDVTLQFAVFTLFFIAIVYIVFTFTNEFQSAATDFRAQQMQSGDASLADAYISLSPEIFLLIRLALAVVLFMMGSMVHIVVGVLLAAAGFFGPSMLLKNLKQKRVKKVEAQLVQGLELLGNCLKSGLTLPQAVELLVKEFPPPISQEFAMVLSENRLGLDFNDAIKNMGNRLNSNIVHILASGVAITKRCGGDLTVIFQNIASTIREQATIEGKLDAVTAQGRFQGLILGLMPFFLIIILWFVDRGHVETLFGYKLGIWAFCTVIMMVALAQLWLRKLLDIDV